MWILSIAVFRILNKSNRIEFDKYFVTRVLILIICHDSVEALRLFKHLISMAERSMALSPLLKAVPGVGSNPAVDINFHFTLSLPFRSSLLGDARTNEFKHNIHPE